MSALVAAQAGIGLLQFIGGLASGKQSAADTTADAATGRSAAAASTGKSDKKHAFNAFERLASAVSSALQSASKGGNAPDVNQTITQVLTKIFKNQSLSPAGEKDPTADPAQSADATSGKNGGLPDEFVQLLQSVGVTPQQFQTDVNNAVAAARQGGSTDFNAAFKSFPAGSLLDAVG